MRPQGHALVVGATSGIGAQVASQLDARGWRVSRFGRSAAGPGGWACDVTDARSVAAAFDAAIEAHGEPRALVYCAGTGVFGRTTDIPVDRARACMDVGFWGMDACVRQVLPAFERRGGGRIVGVLSVVSMIGVAHEAYYAASKAAAQRYLDCLRVELEPAGVRVRYVCPGYVATGFRERSGWFGVEPGVVQGSGVTAADVAATVVRAAEGQTVSPILGWRERLVTTAGRLAPGLYESWQVRQRKRDA
jgi:short-subunit dehydrogenase